MAGLEGTRRSKTTSAADEVSLAGRPRGSNHYKSIHYPGVSLSDLGCLLQCLLGRYGLLLSPQSTVLRLDR